MALIKEYFDLLNKYQDDYGNNTILLMQVGSFYEVYGILNINSQIHEFARICELNIVEKNCSIDLPLNNNKSLKKVIMAGFKDIMIEKYIKKIQEAGFTTVVYNQDEQIKGTSRSLAGIFSPGTYFLNDSINLTNNLTCIWVELIDNTLFFKEKEKEKKKKIVVVGISNIDILTGKTSIFQFTETWINNPTTFDQLERFISIYKPSEVILISNLIEKDINNIINYANINCSLIHKIYLNLITTREKVSQFELCAKNCEKQIYQKEILNKFYKIENFEVFFQNFYENNIATQSFCFMLDFVYQHNPYLVFKISEPIFENCSERLILANHTLTQLNIIDDNNYNGKYSSVLKMLNICITSMGKRHFTNLFLNPTTNISFLQKEYNITEYILQNYDKYNILFKEKLSEIKDLSKLERQIFLKKISPKTFYNLYNNILIIQEIYDIVIEDNFIKEYLQFYEPNINKIKEYCNLFLSFINQNIHIELAKDIDQLQNFEINFIKKGIDSNLDNKTETMIESEDKLESIRLYFNNLIENGERKTTKTTKPSLNDFVKIHETEKNNFSLICTSRRCKLLENALPTSKTFVKLTYQSSYNNIEKDFEYKISKTDIEFHKQSTSNNFISDEQLNKLCKIITTTKVSLKDIITSVFYKFVSHFENYQKELESIIHFITLIDIIYCKATIAKKYNYCKPQIQTNAIKSFVNTKNLRHCLIEYLQTNEIYVTNDITLGDNNTNGILLYGTNAVGKTSLIRALGISLIMAQSGLFVPCSEFIFKPYKYIFTRIIGNDNIFKGLSTFAVEMSELRTILRLSEENSLILGDELCSGTENISAISIFVAGIQQLYKNKSSFIFATHLHEIVNYEEINSLQSIKLKHMAVIYDKEKDLLIYDRKLQDGPGNNMYGLEVCKSLNLPDEFIEAAYQIRMKYNPETASLLSLKTSHFNSKKIMNLCEKCGINIGTEVHHLQHQIDANENGIIITENSIFHKNNIANLITLCEKCHNNFHKENSKHKKVKTTKGYIIKEIK